MKGNHRLLLVDTDRTNLTQVNTNKGLVTGKALCVIRLCRLGRTSFAIHKPFGGPDGDADSG